MPPAYDNHQNIWDEHEPWVWQKRVLIDTKVEDWEKENKALSGKKWQRIRWFSGPAEHRGFKGEPEWEDDYEEESDDDEEEEESDDEEDEVGDIFFPARVGVAGDFGSFLSVDFLFRRWERAYDSRTI